MSCRYIVTFRYDMLLRKALNKREIFFDQTPSNIISKFLSKVTVYALVCTTNPQILIVICCIHLHIRHMSRIPFLILSFLDFAVFVVTTLIFH